MFRLDDDHLELRSLVREIAEREIAPLAAETDEHSVFPRQQLDTLIAADLHVVGVPEEYGGPGADHLAGAVVAEEVARACTTTSQVSGGCELFAVPLLLAGSDEQKGRYLPRIASGEALAAFALSEADAGSDVAAMSTRATAVDDGWRVRGAKRWITNAGVAELYVLFAVTDPQAGPRGISAFVLEGGDDGVSFGGLEQKMGLKGSPTREVYLDDVFLPADRLIGEPGAGMRIALGTLDRTRPVVAAQAVGLAQGALDVAAGYVGQRQQFGQPLAELRPTPFNCSAARVTSVIFRPSA